MDQKSTDTIDENALTDMTVSEDGVMRDAIQTAPVNDIQPPQSVMDVTPPPQDSVISNEEPELTKEPSAEGGTESEESVVPEPRQETIVTPTGADPIDAAPLTATEHKTRKGLIVAISIILAMVLAAIAILVVVKAKGTTKSAASNKSANQTAQNTTGNKIPAAEPVTTADVDTASKEVDTSLSSLDESKDFAPDSLSDKALGL